MWVEYGTVSKHDLCDELGVMNYYFSSPQDYFCVRSKRNTP